MKISLVTGISGDQLHYQLARIEDQTKEFTISSIAITNIREGDFMTTGTIFLIVHVLVLMSIRMSNSNKQHFYVSYIFVSLVEKIM